MNFSEFGIDIKGRTSGLFKATCPKCSDSRKNKRDKCLSVNISEGVWNCHNCGFKGTINKAEKMDKKIYQVPVLNNTELSDKTLEWFVSNRKVSKSTVMRFGLTESIEWMPQVEKEMNCINFNYFRDEKLVNIKFRDGKKDFKMVKDAELIFYNLDSIKDCDEVIICEGEIDCMSFYEVGLYNVVSVPNGASKGNQKLDYLDNCSSYFEDKKKIILATDNDEAGIALRDELARRIGREKCWIFIYPEGCKDANEVLVKGSKEDLKNCMEYIREFPLEGITSVSDIDERINSIYLNGYPTGYKTGFGELDKLISWRKGEFTGVTGIPGSGKSEFIDQVMIKMSMIHDWKWAVFSAENQPEELHFAKLSEKYIGKSFYSSNQEYRMNTEELYKAKVFINDHFFFVNINELNVTLDGLLAKVRELVMRKGVNGFLLDPWNYIEHKIPHGYTETQYISEALTRISRFCKLNNIHIVVVAHPTKISKDDEGKYRVATMYDIAGSAHWFNKIDNGISVYRHFDTGAVDVYIQKIRFKFIGQIGKCSFTWDKFTGRYSEHSENKMPEFFNN
jgi:twinkle protein